jgi:signal transduction histidine kinase
MALLSSLTNRIFLASSLVAVLCMTVAVLVVNVQVTSHAEAELRQRLEESAELVEQYRSLLFETFLREGRLVADLPRLKAAVALDDPPTVAPLAEEYRAQINADLLVLVGRTGRVLGSVGRWNRPLEDAERHAIREAAHGREVTSFWPRPGGLLQVVTVPVWIDPEHPEILGTLTVGFALDHALAARFRALTDSDIVFLAGGRVLASTRPGLSAETAAALSSGSEVRRITLGGEDCVVISRPLAAMASGPAADGAGSGPGPEPSRAPRMVVLRSRTESLRFLNPLHTALAGTALLAVLAAVLVSYPVARTITRPMAALAAAMREMAATGDLARRVPEGAAWYDEDARVLAGTFAAMTESIARFQHDAAQRERLSALGRLSTVVAHEIRNPLMIIKAAVRTLRRATPGSNEIGAALGDIDGEVARINRIVGGVLDFARPIRFEYGTTDLNAVCVDAAAAAAVGDDWPPVALRLDPVLPPLVTDGERLRQALVNVLTNARQAVVVRFGTANEARPAGGGGPARPLVEMATEGLTDRRVRVSIRDRGTGIPADVVGRVFEPFFTTRRAGSGLGLPIALNIIEGLGGTVEVESQAGEGTLIRIELPANGGRQPGARLAAETAAAAS